MPTPLQLLDAASGTCTYLLWDEHTRDAIIIDPVDQQLPRDLATIERLGLRLKYGLETHAHADHITSAAQLIEHTGTQAATPTGCGIHSAAIQLMDGDRLQFGGQTLHAIHTPGHTAGSMCFLVGDNLFTGDTLLIGGCGRTDFQSGSSHQLYNSIVERLYTLDDHITVWPGHDYKAQSASTIGAEKRSNPRTTHNGALRTQAEFVTLMAQLNLPLPKRIHEAVPANLWLGLRHDANAESGEASDPQLATDANYSGDIDPVSACEWWQQGKAVLVDIRSDAERAWVGFVPGALALEWKSWPSMAVNPQFDAALRAALPDPSQPLLMLCRSGLRSVPAARRATTLGYSAYNITEGFEGDPDQNGHRNAMGGWRKRGLPWRQN